MLICLQTQSHYLPKHNIYYEITSFCKNDTIPVDGFWGTYLAKIERKGKFVKNVLKSGFRFLYIKKLNNSQRTQVSREIKRKNSS